VSQGAAHGVKAAVPFAFDDIFFEAASGDLAPAALAAGGHVGLEPAADALLESVAAEAFFGADAWVEEVAIALVEVFLCMRIHHQGSNTNAGVRAQLLQKERNNNN
jgi:hypothetical protein